MNKEALSRNKRKNVIDILAKSFDKNKSVNYILKQDKARQKRVRYLMKYSYQICSKFGKIILSEDKAACALLLYPEQKRVTFQSIIWDIQLVFRCIGIKKMLRTLRRESLIKRLQPKEPMIYLWFIGVDPQDQNKGKGSLLLTSILEESKKGKRMVCLETSTLKNLPWYKKMGFEIYHEENIGYTLYFLNYKFD